MSGVAVLRCVGAVARYGKSRLGYSGRVVQVRALVLDRLQHHQWSIYNIFAASDLPDTASTVGVTWYVLPV